MRQIWAKQTTQKQAKTERNKLQQKRGRFGSNTDHSDNEKKTKLTIPSKKREVRATYAYIRSMND